MRWPLAILPALALVYAQPAVADWEWTQWGMNRVQALAASQGKAAFATSTEKQRRTYRRGFVPVQVPELVVDGKVDGAEVSAYLLFDVDSARLACVDLLPKPGNALPASLAQSLTHSYGPPVQEARKELPGVQWTITTWVDPRDVIELQQGGLGAKLKYCERGKETVALR